MKATGIVRRIDDLGRVVIPKEIRRTMRIRDRDNVIAVSGLPKKELIEKPVSSELENVMNEKIIVSYKDGKPVSVADGVEKYNAGVVVPIVSEGDTIGSVLFILKDGETASEVEEKLAESAAGFLGKHMEG